MFTHNLNPILFDFGLIAIRWYSLAYIIGILSGWWLAKRIIVRKLQSTNIKFNLKEFDDLITFIIISILIGGRLGYIIFYNLGYYLSNPFFQFGRVILFLFFVRYQSKLEVYTNLT